MGEGKLRAIVFALEPLDLARLQRTLRSLSAAEVHATVAADMRALAAELKQAAAPLWLVRSGSWQPLPQAFRNIPSSASGKPLIGIGGKGANSVYVEAEPARVLGGRLEAGTRWVEAIKWISRARAFRSVPLHHIAVQFDPALRIVQLVTTIQLGGAERVTLDLAHECNRTGIPTVVAALGEPTRKAFATPRHFADLSEIPNAPAERAEAVEQLCLEWGADAVHAHLIKAEEAEAIRARGLPLIVTVHNMSPSWPSGYLDATTPFADLFIGCAEAVTREISLRMPDARVRTVWNGIDSRRALSSERAGVELRASLGWHETDFILLAVANPRTQKRLERLPEIVVRVEERIGSRRVRLLLAGEPAIGSGDAREAMTKLEHAIELWHVRKALHWTGAVDDVAPLLSAADVFVSTSAVEGLSLAQLEALAAGLPLVATKVGGAPEIATKSDRVFLLPLDADAEAFANVLARLANAAPPKTSALPKSFTRDRMASRTQLLYRGALVSAAKREGEHSTVWLVTNNFSTGGAQTSARRLLTALAARGHLVRAATIEEAPDRVSPGRRALAEAGIEVSALSPNPNPESLAETLLDTFAACPPHAVVFWNLITPVKVLIADALLDIPVFDVSPGEMYFQSLDRFFSSPPAGLPISSATEYGARLAGVVVKYVAEASTARETLATPVHVIPNGIPLAPARGRPPARRLIIGTAARISADKRLDQLVEVVRIAQPNLGEFELHIAGGADGGNSTYFRELRKSARGLPVRWLGHVDDITGFLANLDIFVMISEPAGCPNASLEAMAAGLPIIATDHGGASEQIIDGVNGRLVPRADTTAFASALVALTQNPATRLSMGAASRVRIESTFSLERMVEAYSTLLGLPSK